MSRSACQVEEEGCHLQNLLLLQGKAGWFLGLVPSRFFFYFCLHPSPSIFIFSLAVPPLPSPTSAPFFTLPPLTFQPPPPPTDVGPAAALGVQGTDREVGQRSSENRQGVCVGEQEMVPLTLLECGRSRPLWKKELSPHPSRQPQTAVMPHNTEAEHTTNQEASRHWVQLHRLGAFIEDFGPGSHCTPHVTHPYPTLWFLSI